MFCRTVSISLSVWRRSPSSLAVGVTVLARLSAWHCGKNATNCALARQKRGIWGVDEGCQGCGLDVAMAKAEP